MEIQEYIAELLSQHDCVIVPGLGGFIGSYIPAQIHPVYHTFQPPSKKILFNINLRQNDGLLVNHIAQAHQLSFQEASVEVSRFAEATLLALKSRKYLILKNIGKLYTGTEGNIQFDQDLRTNHLADSFGLQPFFSSPVSTTDRFQEKRVNRIVPQQNTMDLVRRAFPKPLKWAAILAIPVSLTVMLSVAGYDSFTSGSWNTANLFSSLSPFSKPTMNQQPSATLSTVPEEKPEAEPAVNVPTYIPAHRPVISDEPVPLDQPVAAATEMEPNVSYAVIVGAFSIEGNAGKLIRQMEKSGITATIFDRSPGGLFRVAAGVYTSQDEAEKRMQSMKQNGFSGAWLLKK